MKIIKQSWSFMYEPDKSLIFRVLEEAGRNCYKSEGKIEPGSAAPFIKGIMNRQHESVIEHMGVSVRIITDRGVSHELVRHRIASYSQESTRFCNYAGDRFGKDLTLVLPVRFYQFHEYATVGGCRGLLSDDPMFKRYYNWLRSMEKAGEAYFEALELGEKPQEARDVLPNSLKTEVVATMNMRSWRNFFKQRAAPAAHPQMQDLARSMVKGFQEKIPILFDDFFVK